MLPVLQNIQQQQVRLNPNNNSNNNFSIVKNHIKVEHVEKELLKYIKSKNKDEKKLWKKCTLNIIGSTIEAEYTTLNEFPSHTFFKAIKNYDEPSYKVLFNIKQNENPINKIVKINNDYCFVEISLTNNL